MLPVYGKPEVGLTPEQGSSIIARFKAKIAKLEEEHADEKKKLQSEHTAAHEAFLKGACQNYSSQIEKLCAENKRLKEENAEVKCLKENLIKNEVKQYDKFEVLLAEKMDLEKDITRKEAKIKGLEDEVAELKKDNAELEKGLAKLGEYTGMLRSNFTNSMAALDISRDSVIQASQKEKNLEKKVAELEDENKTMKEGISALAMLVKK